MQPRPGLASVVVPIAIISLGMLQAASALRTGRDVGAASWALVVIVGAAGMRRGMAVPDSVAWRVLLVVLALLVFGTLFLALGASLWARAV